MSPEAIRAVGEECKRFSSDPRHVDWMKLKCAMAVMRAISDPKTPNKDVLARTFVEVFDATR